MDCRTWSFSFFSSFLTSDSSSISLVTRSNLSFGSRISRISCFVSLDELRSGANLSASSSGGLPNRESMSISSEFFLYSLIYPRAESLMPSAILVISSPSSAIVVMGSTVAE